ncbi:MAG: GtrA family protein [Sporolactobacillus sp.]|nr:GtrA family protein [Sporolactobacillus sp.]
MGVLTTVINVVCFFILVQYQMDYRIATTVAWLVSVLFAYVTNKHYVFKSKTSTITSLLKEMLSFFWFRLLSYFLDLGSMIIMVSFLNLNETWAKIIANILVVIINYVLSKWIIFKHHGDNNAT